MRFNRSIREPIPWETKQSDSLNIWEWKTSHLMITIMGEGSELNKIYHWKIHDLSNGNKSAFDEGPGVSFNDCVDQAIEIVSKSWPRHMGYSKYAGHLAYTFKIGEGSLVNFESIIGKEVILVVKSNEGSQINLIGSLDVKHYDITVTQSSQTVVIPPGRVLDVRSGQGKSLIEELSEPIKLLKK